MTIFLLINKYCARCEFKLNEDERITCCDCTLIVGPKPDDAISVCFLCGDAWAHKVTSICNDCVQHVETYNHTAI